MISIQQSKKLSKTSSESVANRVNSLSLVDTCVWSTGGFSITKKTNDRTQEHGLISKGF